MTEQTMVPFEVKVGRIEEARAAVREFIEHIRAKEPQTLFYTSLQHKDNPRKFVHFMVFTDSKSHQLHRGTPYVQSFVRTLYPLCVKEPQPIFLEQFDSCGVVAETLARASSGASDAG